MLFLFPKRETVAAARRQPVRKKAGMSSQHAQSANVGPASDTKVIDLQGNASVRLLAVFAPESLSADNRRSFMEQTAAYLSVLLREHWGEPRAFVQVTSTIYLLGQGYDDSPVGEDVDALRQRAAADLFADPDAADVEVATLLSASDRLDAMVRELVGDRAFADMVERLQSVGAWARGRAAVEARENASDGGPSDASGEPTPPAERVIAWRYRSVFDMPNSALFSAVLTPEAPWTGLADLSFPGVWDAEDADHEDRAVEAMRIAARALAAAEADSPRLITLPIHFEMLALRSRRNTLIDRARRYQPAFKQFVGCTIVAGPQRPSSELLANAVQDLQQAFLRVDWQTDEVSTDSERFRYSQLHSVTLNVPRCAIAGSPVKSQELERMRRELHAVKIRFGVCGVAREGDLAPLKNCGVDYVMGDVVAPATAEPPPPQRVTLQSLPLGGPRRSA